VRRPVFRGAFALPGELVVDSFAGGGGASTGIEAALNRPVDIAINHDAEAIAMHKANHPETRHYQEDIFEVDPVAACAGRPVGLAWFSPDCTHFSRAKGTTPVKKEIRGLAWVVINWARAVRPRVIILENVEEFQTWGPLAGDRPDPARAGETFREWLAELRGCGYQIEFQTLVAADYGAPTTRKRLYLVARREGAIAWPTATHGAGRPTPWRPAAEIIDWSLPCPSIFERKRPLVEATMRRIANGIRRFVVESANPFIVPVKTWGGGGNGPRSLCLPMRTVTASKRGEFALVEPFVVGAGGPAYQGKPAPSTRPLGTVVGENHRALVSPFIVRHGHYSTKTGAGLREGCGAGTFRGQQLVQPVSTVCATNDKHLVMPFLAAHYGRGGTVGRDAREPMRTVTPKDHNALVAPFLAKYYGTSADGQAVTDPMPTVTAGGRRGGGHVAEVCAFLLKYYGAGGEPDQQQSLFDPLHTVPSRDRFGLVMVAGVAYQIVDIGMRMLQPHELFAAQGFPPDYEIAPEFNGRPLSKSAQTSCAGNSVCPPMAEAIVAANVMEAA